MNTDTLNQALDSAKLAQDQGNEQLANSYIDSWYYNRLSSGDIGIENKHVNQPGVKRFPIPMVAYNPRAYPGNMDAINHRRPVLTNNETKEGWVGARGKGSYNNRYRYMDPEGNGSRDSLIAERFDPLGLGDFFEQFGKWIKILIVIVVIVFLWKIGFFDMIASMFRSTFGTNKRRVKSKGRKNVRGGDFDYDFDY